LDINMGGIILCMSFLEYTMDSETNTFLRFGLFIGGLLLFNAVFWGGKKFITIPRLGQAKFGPQRKRRGLIMASVMAAIVLLQVILLVGTVLLWKNPGWATDLGLHTTDRDVERMIVAFTGALFVGPSMILLAYFSDFLRGYYIAIILSLAVFSMIWFGEPIYLIIAGLLIIIPGVVLFVRFLREHPLPPAQASHD